jgi:hypothetical protein
MTQDDHGSAASFEVALQGASGPAVRAALLAMGVRQIRTTSRFLLPVRDGEGICEIVEDLGRRGMQVLDVRPAALGVREGS